jgi:RNA polymerase sigma factor (sigma-70 family)
MAEDLSMGECLARWPAGDGQAAEQIFARYAVPLTHLADRHLSRRLAPRVDGEDVVQSVFRTFFRRAAGGEFRIDGSAQLWRLLVQITVRKARAVGRHGTAGCRDVRVEIAGDADLIDAAAREPGPDEVVVFLDQIEALLSGLPALHAQVLDLRLQGHAAAEIAPRLGVSRRTVYRVLELLQRRLQDRIALP